MGNLVISMAIDIVKYPRPLVVFCISRVLAPPHCYYSNFQEPYSNSFLFSVLAKGTEAYLKGIY
jgi:hypothetical protein